MCMIVYYTTLEAHDVDSSERILPLSPLPLCRTQLRASTNLFHGFEQILHRQSLAMVHGVGLATPRLAIGKHRGVAAVEHEGDQGLHRRGVQRFGGVLGAKRVVVLERQVVQKLVLVHRRLHTCVCSRVRTCGRISKRGR